MTIRRTTRWIAILALTIAVPTEALAVIRVTIRPITLQSAGPSDTAATLPTAQTQYLPGETFVVELWAQTTETNGLSSVTVDMSFVNTVVTAQSITHTALFNAAGLSTGTINNPGGLVDNLGGSHVAASPPCSAQVGLTNWARVAVVDMQALANGTSIIQSADTASLILGTAICNEFGNVVPADIDFGQVTVTVRECFNNADCDDTQFCNGPEQCVSNVCQAGTAPNCADVISCTDDSCDPAASAGTGACLNAPNDANCDDNQFCTGVETCSATLDCQAGTAPNCADAISCTDDSCDPAANAGTGACLNAPNDANCDDNQFCTGVETCSATLDCQAGTAPNCADVIACTDDSCDPAANAGTGACLNAPNDANCDDNQFCTGVETCSATLDCQAGTAPNCADVITCTDDSCDPAANAGTGACLNAPNDASCDDNQFCTGVETCSATLDCQAGAAVCTATCEHCDEAGGSCELCILDLDFNGVMGTGDFGLFSGCFDGCYLATDPCAASNFDGDPGICVGTGDFAGFVGCFGLNCASCGNCAGPPPVSAASQSSSTESTVNISLVTVRVPTVDDSVAVLPRSGTSFRLGQPFFVEVWATRSTATRWDGDGLAAVFVDLSFETDALIVEEVIPGDRMSMFAGGMIQPELGMVSQLGGCSRLDSLNLGAMGNWVRVATLAVRSLAPGLVRFEAGPSDPVHGVAIVNELGNLDPFQIEFGASVVNVVQTPAIHDGQRRFKAGSVPRQHQEANPRNGK